MLNLREILLQLHFCHYMTPRKSWNFQQMHLCMALGSPTERVWPVETSNLCISLYDREKAEVCASGERGFGPDMGLWRVQRLSHWRTFSTRDGLQASCHFVRSPYQLPPRVQQFCLRLMRCSYSTWLQQSETTAHQSPNNEVWKTVAKVNGGQFKEDTICAEIVSLCQRGWPDSNQHSGPAKAYWPETALLTVHDGLLLKDSRLVISTAMPEKQYGGQA